MEEISAGGSGNRACARVRTHFQDSFARWPGDGLVLIAIVHSLVIMPQV
jgi:hypothetical protein